MTSSKKGINTFKGYQEAKQSRREDLIEAYLQALKLMRQEFKHITQLAEMVALHITHVEKADSPDRRCSASTLLRNKRYKALLLSYMAEQMTGGVKRVRGQKIDPSAMEMVLVQAELEILNLKNENQRLKLAYTAQLEDQVAHQERQRPALESQDMRKVDATMADLQFKYAQTCKAMLRLLERLHNYVSVDQEEKSIVDLSIKRGAKRAIVGPEEAGPFCEWLKDHSFLIGNAQ